MVEIKGALSENLHLNCQPSRLHIVVLVLTHASTLYALSLLSKYSFVQELAIYLLAIIVCLSAVYFCRLAYHLHPECIVELEAVKEGSEISWKIGLRSGETRAVKLKNNVLVWPRIIVCQFIDSEKTYPLVLLPDSVDGRSHRHARIYFSLYGAKQNR
jgi:hypothetical protein